MQIERRGEKKGKEKAILGSNHLTVLQHWVISPNTSCPFEIHQLSLPIHSGLLILILFPDAESVPRTQWDYCSAESSLLHPAARL